MNVDRFDRIALLVIGALLLAAGSAGLLAHTDALGWSLRDRVLADNPVSRYAADNGRWLWPVVVACAVVVLVLAVKWMLAVLLATDRLRTVALRPEPDAGEHTTLAGPALEEAVRDQIEGDRGVASAKVRLLGEPQKPIMAVGVRTSAPGRLAALCDRIEHGALADARRVLGRPDLPVRVDLDTGRRPGRVV